MFLMVNQDTCELAPCCLLPHNQERHAIQTVRRPYLISVRMNDVETYRNLNL
jgi:hypothetical protein